MKPFFKTDDHFENPFFIGTVVSNEDSTFNYRVKVRIDKLHDTISDKNLPWAAKVDSSFMGMDSSAISHSIPEVGSKVLILMVGDNINSLIYLGCLYKKVDSTPTGDEYLNTYGIYGKSGEFISVDKINALIKLLWKGDIDISIEGKTTANTGEINLTVNGDVNLTANTTNIKSNVKIDGTLNVTGLVQGDADVKAGGGSVGLLTHVHPGVFPGPSNTGTGQG